MPATPAEDAQAPVSTLQLLTALQDAVSAALERKRRLGHYAVVWQHGGPVTIGDDAPVLAHALHAAEPAPAAYGQRPEAPKS